MMAFEILSQDLALGELSALRIRSLLTDPKAFGEEHETAVARSESEWRAWLAERTNGTDRMIFVLTQDGSYRGMCGAGIRRDDETSGFLWGVYVAPDLRGSGGAGLLVDAAHAWLQAQGVGRVEAEVAAQNPRALKFYRKAGYRIVPQATCMAEGEVLLEIKLAN